MQIEKHKNIGYRATVNTGETFSSFTRMDAISRALKFVFDRKSGLKTIVLPVKNSILFDWKTPIKFRRVSICEFNLCDGSGKVEHQTDVDDSFIKKCNCKK